MHGKHKSFNTNNIMLQWKSTIKLVALNIFQENEWLKNLLILLHLTGLLSAFLLSGFAQKQELCLKFSFSEKNKRIGFKWLHISLFSSTIALVFQIFEEG